MSRSIGVAQILPSPILPVRARVADDLDHLVDVAGLGEHLDHDLRNEVDLVLVAAEGLGLAALAAVSLDLDDGEAEDAGAAKRFLDLFEFERLDDCGHEMSHALVLLAERFG